jgi:adenylate cyclase
VYPLIFPTPEASAGLLWHSILNGFLVGLFAGLAVSLGEQYLFQSRLRRLPFSAFLAVQTFFYLAVISLSHFVVLTLHMVVFHGLTFDGAFHSSEFEDFYGHVFWKMTAYALAVIFMLNFLRQVNRMLGRNMLVDFFIGKYHTPVEEQRVFMFLDLNGSTAMAEKLGHKRYHQLLDDFFYDITPPILETKGEVYQYVGDEVVVTWMGDRGLREANCLRCYFRMVAAIADADARYERKYGLVPRFKAGCHYGKVVAGLSGDLKRNIVYHGDTVNTAARIRSECTAANRPLLLSGDLLKHLAAIRDVIPENMGRIKLRGKEEEIELFAIKNMALS